MRKPLIAGNWKMHTTISEAASLAEGIKKELSDFSKVDIVLCPPFISLDAVYKVIMDTSIKLGAQNVAWEKEGAYTGEISNIMLRDCGCKFAIVGHSERSKYFCESNKTVHKSIKSLAPRTARSRAGSSHDKTSLSPRKAASARVFSGDESVSRS